MSDDTGALAARLASRTALAAALLLLTLFALRRFNDYDVFWHVRTGDWMLAAHAIPRVDPFGAITAGTPWLDVAWAAQLGMALLSTHLGFGLVGLQLVAVAILVVSLAALLARGPASALVLAGTLLFALTAWPRLLVRPDVLSIPLTFALFLLLARVPAAPWQTVASFALLALVWTNVHGSFVFLLLVLGAAAAATALRRSSRELFVPMAAALGAAVGASLANPYGPRLYALFAPYVASMLAPLGIVPAAQRLTISEWAPTWRMLAWDPVYPRVAYLLLVAAVVGSFALLRRSVSLVRVAATVVALGLSLAVVRHLTLFAAAAVCVIALNERDRQAERRARWLDAPALRIAAAVAIVLVAGIQAWSVVTDRFYVARDVPNRTGVGVDLELLPEGAAQWLASHEWPGLAFNNFDSGAYLLYRLYPRFRPYIDARVVDARLFRENQQAILRAELFDRIVERDGIGTVILLHPSSESITLLPRLVADPRWRLAFRDHNTTIHVRADLASPAPRATPWPLAPVEQPLGHRVNRWLARWKRECLPAAELTDAFLSQWLGDPAAERAAYARAIARCPTSPRARDYFRKGSAAPPR